MCTLPFPSCARPQARSLSRLHGAFAVHLKALMPDKGLPDDKGASLRGTCSSQAHPLRSKQQQCMKASLLPDKAFLLVHHTGLLQHVPAPAVCKRSILECSICTSGSGEHLPGRVHDQDIDASGPQLHKGGWEEVDAKPPVFGCEHLHLAPQHLGQPLPQGAGYSPMREQQGGNCRAHTCSEWITTCACALAAQGTGRELPQ